MEAMGMFSQPLGVSCVYWHPAHNGSYRVILVCASVSVCKMTQIPPWGLAHFTL